MVSIIIHDRHGQRVLDAGAQGSVGTVGTAYGGTPRKAPRPDKPPGAKAGSFTVDQPGAMAAAPQAQAQPAPQQQAALPGARLTPAQQQGARPGLQMPGSTHQAAAQQHEALAQHHVGLNYGGQNPISRAHTEAAKAHKTAHSLLGKPGYQQAANWANSATEHAKRLSRPQQHDAKTIDAWFRSPNKRAQYSDHRTIDEWFTDAFDPSKHPKGGDPENTGRFSKGSGSKGGESEGGEKEAETSGRARNIQGKPGTRPPGRGAQSEGGQTRRERRQAAREAEKPEAKPEGEKVTKAESPAKSIFQDNPVVTPDEFYNPANNHLSPDDLAAISDVKDQINQGYKGKKGFDTQQTYKPGGHFEGKVYKGGEYTAARKKKHEEIIDKLFSAAKTKAATPSDGSPPTFIMLGGRGGSGKSYFTEGNIKHGGEDKGIIDPSKHILIDSDWFKKELGSEGWDAAHYHEEASDLVETALKMGREQGLNVILDATMKSAGSAEKNLTAFEEAGFKTEGHYMSTPLHVAAKNSMARFKTDKNDFSGRFVPPEYILDSKTNEETFDGLRHRFGDWSVWSNPDGRSPTRYASKSDP